MLKNLLKHIEILSDPMFEDLDATMLIEDGFEAECEKAEVRKQEEFGLEYLLFC